jgi:hypothetical protein
MKTLLTGLLTAALFAQEAVVISIPEKEAAALKLKFEILKKALKDFEDAKFDAEKVATDKLFKETGNLPICGALDFTADFKHAVPKQCSMEEIVERLSKDADGGTFMHAPRSEKL